MKSIISLLLLVLMCIYGSSQDRNEEKKNSKQNDESLEVTSQIGENTILHNGKSPVEKDSTAKVIPGQVRIIQDERISTIDLYFSERPIKPVGFRVQLTFGTRDQVNKTKAQFYKYYPGIPIYEDFLPPNFRLRAGDFINKLQAERFKAMINVHFPAAYIVKTNIEVPEKYKRKD